MERAAERVAFDRAAMAEMRAEMRAIGVEQSGLALFVPEQHQVPPEIMHRSTSPTASSSL